MNCSIKDTKASEFLKVSSKKMEPGYFDTPKFIKQFGEWRPSKLSEAQIAENSKNALRFNDDGSPRLDVNDYGVVFFVDKSNNKIPIIEEMFKTLPLEIRSETSNEIMDALVSDLVLSYLNKNEEFLAGEKVQNFALDKYLDAKIKQFKDEGRLSKIGKVSLEESMPDYLEGIKHKLYRLGIKVQNDAVKELQSIERPTTDKASPTIKAVMQFVPKVGGDVERIDSKLIIDQPTFMSPSEVW